MHKKGGMPAAVRKAVDKIVEAYGPQKVILFGSWAWGNPGPESDVDFFIVKEDTRRRIDRERELRKELFGNKLPPLDLFLYTPGEIEERVSIGDGFVKEIVEKGTVVYAQ